MLVTWLALFGSVVSASRGPLNRPTRIRAAVRSLKLTFHLHHSLLPLRAIPLDSMPLVGGLGARTFDRSTFMLYARDTKDILEPNETQRNTLIIAAVYIVVIGILWYVLFDASLQRHSCGP